MTACDDIECQVSLLVHLQTRCGSVGGRYGPLKLDRRAIMIMDKSEASLRVPVRKKMLHFFLRL